MSAYSDSPVSVANLIKWSMIMVAFVIVGCIFINVRSQQVAKEREVRDLLEKNRELALNIQSVESEIKRNRAPKVLINRLQGLDSLLSKVNVNQTEELLRPMTAETRSRWDR